MKPILISLVEDNPLLKSIAKECGYEVGDITLRNFPDGESYIQINSSLKNKDVIIINSLDRPNSKILPLLFSAETAKEMGAKRVGLCAPYLAYMRQDKRFKPGEGITSTYFAALLSQYFDWLVTVDPHLHRRHNLSDIYSIPNTVLHASLEISKWIRAEVENPVLIGPDSESEQWVSEVAKSVGAPYLVLEKIRHGDRDVAVSQPIVESFLNHTPVLVDDIISTARTMIETVNQLKKLNMKSAVCVGVHAVFADKAYEGLVKLGVASIATCNTINHSTNKIDVSSLIVSGIQKQLERV